MRLQAGTAPIRRQLAVLKRQSCPHFRVSELTSLPSIVALEKLEKWDRVMVQWMDFGRYEEMIDLDDDVHTYFVRVRGLVCAGFGRELDVSERAEERFGYPRQAVSESIIGPKEGYMWVALWNEVRIGTGPECSTYLHAGRTTAERKRTASGHRMRRSSWKRLRHS